MNVAALVNSGSYTADQLKKMYKSKESKHVHSMILLMNQAIVKHGEAIAAISASVRVRQLLGSDILVKLRVWETMYADNKDDARVREVRQCTCHLAIVQAG